MDSAFWSLFSFAVSINYVLYGLLKSGSSSGDNETIFFFSAISITTIISGLMCVCNELSTNNERRFLVSSTISILLIILVAPVVYAMYYIASGEDIFSSIEIQKTIDQFSR